MHLLVNKVLKWKINRGISLGRNNRKTILNSLQNLYQQNEDESQTAGMISSHFFEGGTHINFCFYVRLPVHLERTKIGCGNFFRNRFPGYICHADGWTQCCFLFFLFERDEKKGVGRSRHGRPLGYLALKIQVRQCRAVKR